MTLSWFWCVAAAPGKVHLLHSSVGDFRWKQYNESVNVDFIEMFLRQILKNVWFYNFRNNNTGSEKQ